MKNKLKAFALALLALVALSVASQLPVVRKAYAANVTLQAAIAAIAFDPDFNAHKLRNVADPALAQDVATKNYADVTMALGESRLRTATAALTAAPSFNSQRITLVADPSGAQDVATKNYADVTMALGESRLRTAAAALTGAFNTNAQNVVNVGQLGIGTASPTHGVTLAAANSLALNNQADISTNYERITLGFSTNVGQLFLTKGGTGTQRTFQVGTGATVSTTYSASGNINQASSVNGTTAAAGFACSGINSTTLQQTMVGISGTVNQASGSGGADVLLLNPTFTAVGSAGGNFIKAVDNATELFRVDRFGKITQSSTVTAGGTTGNQTINKPSGTVNVAAAGTSLVVTDSVVSTSSIVLPVTRTNDSTCSVKNIVPGSGSFTVNMTAACTAETSVGFVVIN